MNSEELKNMDAVSLWLDVFFESALLVKQSNSSKEALIQMKAIKDDAYAKRNLVGLKHIHRDMRAQFKMMDITDKVSFCISYNQASGLVDEKLEMEIEHFFLKDISALQNQEITYKRWHGYKKQLGK